MTPHLLSASTLEGTNVENTQGENIGEIKDLMIDWKHGSVGYAVLSFGGFLGLGEKLFAIPLQAFQFDNGNDERRIILNVSKDQLENAPGFDKDQWPQHADRSFIGSVYSHYGYKPYWEKSAEDTLGSERLHDEKIGHL